jgi:hypothetical protein
MVPVSGHAFRRAVKDRELIGFSRGLDFGTSRFQEHLYRLCKKNHV